MPEREVKVRTGVSVDWKADAEGSFRAVIATLNVRDKDGDVTRPNAFQAGQRVRISAWNHGSWQGALPVGKGVIGADGKEAWVDGSFFLDTTHGLDTYRTVKNLESLQEWSYGFDVAKASFGQFEGQEVRFLEGLNVYEAAPVLLGAGEGTRTQMIKSLESGSLTIGDHADVLHAGASTFLKRLEEIKALRAKEGRVLSQANRDRLSTLLESMRVIGADVEELLRASEPAPKDGDNEGAEDGAKLFLAFQATRARLRA